MSKEEKSVGPKIDRKWVRENKRFFSEYPGILRSGIAGEEELWLELAQFYRDDLRWLLSLEHHKFWSFMIYSEQAHQMLLSFLKKSVPYYMRNNFLVRDEMRKLFTEIEHLVFLVFLRLSTEKESESCFIRNFHKVIYNNYLFTVPIILDLCLIYGTSNFELVKKMVNDVVSSAPDFLDDFQEIIPHFIQVLKTVKEKMGKDDKKLHEIEDLVLYLSDSVATIQVFFMVYPSVCRLFSRGEVVTEIVQFYCNILPELLDSCQSGSKLVGELIENVRIDLLRIVKNILDFVVSEANEIPEKKDEIAMEYLTVMSSVVSEPVFLYDYNQMYSVEFEVGCAMQNFGDMDGTKVNHILEAVADVVDDSEKSPKKSYVPDDDNVKANSLITEIKDIFNHLDESYIRQCLKYYNNDTERVIAAVLENSVPPDLDKKKEEVLEFKGKHKNKHSNLNEMLDDREEIMKMKERYAELSFVDDETYDDEYDDTYDDNVDISAREVEEVEGRAFVVPRVLRTREEVEEEEAEEEEEEEEVASRRDQFVEDPAVVRERMMQARMERSKRDVAGRGRGQGQSKQVVKNREFKESHKSFMANHNRKKQASRKMGRGMIPT